MRQTTNLVSWVPKRVRLPKVEKGDPTSWLAFRGMFEIILTLTELSEEEKLAQLLCALPSGEAVRVANLSFEEALAVAKQRLESPEVLIEMVREEFSKIPEMEYELDYQVWKSIHEVIEKVVHVTKDTEVWREAFMLTRSALPPAAYLSFVDVYKNSSNLEDLCKFLKARAGGILHIGKSLVRKKDESIHKASEKQKLVQVIDQDEREPMLIWATTRSSKDKSGLRDDININAIIGDKQMCLKYDTAAAEILVPASMFPGHVMNRKFWSASKHVIRAAGPIKMNMIVNGSSIPIKAYVNEANLAILGKPFTNRCSTTSDGTTTRKVTLHFEGKDIVVYSKPSKTKRNRQRMRKTATPKATSGGGNIWSVLPCAAESDLEEEEEQCEPVKARSINSPKLARLLNKWKHLGEGLGDTDIVTHRIYLKKDTKPVNCRGRRFPVKSMEKAKKSIGEMVKLGVIEDSQSEWSSAPLPVPKKNGTIRLAIDYREVNDLCQKDSYPMARIDEKLYEGKIFSKLDLVKGYYQVRIHPKDRHITAFRFGKKLYQFVRMPFGLSSAPQTFQRLMNKVLEDLPFAECYLDDVVIFSSNLDEHLIHLEQVFKALQKANLRFNREKCEFAVEEVEYLGFKICRNRRSPTADKVQAILNFPQPSTKKELLAFIGLINSYRNLIKYFSSKAAPLYELQNKTKKNEKLTWQQEQLAAFELLKRELTKPPVVTLPDCSKPFIVRTDASGTGMGAVLQQEIDGQRRVIEYWSQEFKGAQLRYPTIQKEAVAIDRALKKWRHFLVGSEFTLETDHRPLQYLNSMKDTTGMLGRMALRVQQFMPFKIVHIPGKENIEADILSRMVAAITLDYSELDDIHLRKLEVPTDFVEDDHGRFRFVGDGKNRLAIPKKHRQEVLKALHDHFGHFSIDRVLPLARDRFYWKTMAQDIKAYAQACHSCDIMKDSPQPKAVMKPTAIEVNEAFQRWHVDVIGPLRESKQGNRYVLVGQDAFSKWPEAKAVPSCTTEAITNWVSSHIVDRFGVPVEMMTDQGSQFDSAEFQRYSTETGFRRIYSAAYRHQTNGIVERFNATLEAELRTTALHSDEWDEVVDRCLLAYRCTVHKSTKKSPFEVVYGKKPRIPVDGLFELDAPQSEKSRETIVAETRQAIIKEASRSKARYDKSKRAQRPRDFHGQKVYWRNLLSNPPEGKHLAPRYRGPFRAERTESEYNYRIVDRDGNYKVVHVDQLKPCFNEQALADGLRRRGRPRRINSIVFHNSSRPR